MAPVARAAAVVCRLCLPQIQDKQYNYIVDNVTELRSSNKVKVAILGSLSLTLDHTVSVDIKQCWAERRQDWTQEQCEGRGGCPGFPALNSPYEVMVSVDVKQHWTGQTNRWKWAKPSSVTSQWCLENSIQTSYGPLLSLCISFSVTSLQPTTLPGRQQQRRRRWHSASDTQATVDHCRGWPWLLGVSAQQEAALLIQSPQDFGQAYQPGSAHLCQVSCLGYRSSAQIWSLRAGLC